MKKYLRILLSLFLPIFLVSAVTSCSDEPQQEVEKHRLILIYAIAANSLEYNLTWDLDEILSVAPKLDLAHNKLVVYQVRRDAVCELKELVKNSKKNTFEFKTVKEYPELPLSTSPERIREVMEDVETRYDYPSKGLILWSHATGWIPWFKGDTPKNEKRKSFGQDIFDSGNYQTNINELAEAIPAGMVDFIWFDCCYMGNIETIYELRDKTDWIVGSVLEVPEDGMPYQLTMPYLLRKNPDLEEAAFQFYSFYDSKNSRYYAASISVVNTQELERLADTARDIFANGGYPNLTGIQNYSRLSGTPFYDMGQLLDSYANITENEKENLNQALKSAVVCKFITDYDFNGRFINVADYSGLSIHNFTDNNTDSDNFYKELDWYNATR